MIARGIMFMEVVDSLVIYIWKTWNGKPH